MELPADPKDLIPNDADEQLRRDLADIAEAQRRAWRESWWIVIG